MLVAISGAFELFVCSLVNGLVCVDGRPKLGLSSPHTMNTKLVLTACSVLSADVPLQCCSQGAAVLPSVVEDW